jgi:hypothetical protein
MNYIASKRGAGRYKRSFRSGFYKDRFEGRRNAKEHKRLNPEPLPDEDNAPELVLPAQKFATVTIRCGAESVSFRVSRWDEKTLMMRGVRQVPNRIGKRVALVLDAVL